MKNSVNLNSAEWCDIIFEGKNKSYGAFELRQSSTKRHLIAFGVILLLTTLIACLPSIISTVKAATATYTSKVDGEYTVIDVDNTKMEQPEITPPEMPEPPKVEYVKMTKFVPPTIVDDSNVSEQEEMANMSEVAAGTDAIGQFTVEEGSTSATAVRKEFEQEVTAGVGDGQPKKKEILITAQFMPQYPGGNAEMYKYIGDNLKYPVVDQEMGIEGRVTVRFVVNETGDISNLELIKGISPTCDKEAMRVIKSMPRWIPGKQNGTPVPVYFTMPIVFKLKR